MFLHIIPFLMSLFFSALVCMLLYYHTSKNPLKSTSYRQSDQDLLIILYIVPSFLPSTIVPSIIILYQLSNGGAAVCPVKSCKTLERSRKCIQERLRELGLFSLEKRGLGAPYHSYSSLEGRFQVGTSLSYGACRATGNGFKLRQGRFRLYI